MLIEIKLFYCYYIRYVLSTTFKMQTETNRRRMEYGHISDRARPNKTYDSSKTKFVLLLDFVLSG